MNTNTLVFDLMRSKWLINTDNVAEYEKLANRFITGDYKGETIDREAFKASYMAATTGGVGGMKQDEKKVIGYLQMVGPMTTYGGMCSYGADDYLQALRYMNNSEKISAIVLEVDGPGGAVPAINAFKEFQGEKKKPIVVLCNDLCSLHYWMSCLVADHIMAKGDISPCIGSIGATCILVDSREAMKKEGYSIKIINAPGSELKNKAMADFYAGKDEEFVSRLESELKPIRDAFANDVKESRPNISDDKRIFGADTFSATEALKLGLIDSIGNEKKAFELAQALAELNEN
ncbi:S49 family peptidase [Chryseobacterium sp. MP_3.2]|uniref:S49 family peptidase n=1 Tax=Chryseobacterium sp. MP_3.2 TaxID=3071712 RepID=UPI002DF7F732|nr:protease-4 [Chryseobacterium sp. MP_3.2]